MVEQLSNAKHQAEVAESLLKRKERRVQDLENQLTEVTSTSDSYRFEMESLKSKLHSYENDSFRYTSENDRLSRSYEVLQSSFNDYKLSMSRTIADLKDQIPSFIQSQCKSLSNNLANLKDNQPTITTNFNLLTKNSKRLEELYSQKYDKVNNYLVLLTQSTRQHGQATSIVLEECEEILKKINRNEDVMLRIKTETDGNLTDTDKIKELTKLRDLSILQTSTSPSVSPSPVSSPSFSGPGSGPGSGSRSVSASVSASTPSSTQTNIRKSFEKRVVSPSPNLSAESRFHSHSRTPSTAEDTVPNNNNNNNNNNRRKRNSLNANSNTRRSRNPSGSYHSNHNHRQSLTQDDFANMSFEDYKKRVYSNGNIPTQHQHQHQNQNGNVGGSGGGGLSRSGSVKRGTGNGNGNGHRKSRNFSSNANGSSSGNGIIEGSWNERRIQSGSGGGNGSGHNNNHNQ